MKYPKFISKNSTIGICAPSAGMGKENEGYDSSKKILKKQGYKIKESSLVFSPTNPSGKPKKRAKEFNEMIVDKNVDMVMASCGGDFLFEMIPYTDFESINDNPKWVMGASDPTTLLYTITCRNDIATIYGHNGGSFEEKFKEKAEDICLGYLKGNLVRQYSSKKYERGWFEDKRHFDYKTVWKSNKEEIRTSGRIIGGCLDALDEIIGTKYDYTNDFLNRYKDERIIWYFDIYALNSDNTYRLLWKMKQLGYFKNTDLVLIGRVCFENEQGCVTTYEKAYKRAFGNIDYIYEMDIGHTSPKMTIINGAICDVRYKNGKGSIGFKLK